MNIKYTKEMLEKAVSQCLSWRQLILYFNLKENGGNYKTLKNKCLEFEINTEHFNGKGWNKPEHNSFGNSIDLSKRFVLHEKKVPASKTKSVLLNHNLKDYKCECCGISEWNGKYIVLELHHKNGNNKDDRLENLQLLCPNCHSQTHNYCKRKELL